MMGLTEDGQADEEMIRARDRRRRSGGLGSPVPSAALMQGSTCWSPWRSFIVA